MFNILTVGEKRSLIEKQHYLPRTLLKRWANEKSDYYAFNKKTKKENKYNTIKFQDDPFYIAYIYEIAGSSITNMLERTCVYEIRN